MIAKILISLALISLIQAAPGTDDPSVPHLNQTVNLSTGNKNSFLTPYAKARDLFWGGQTDLMLFIVNKTPEAELLQEFEEAGRLLLGKTKVSVVEYKGNCDMITCGFELENATFPVIGFVHMSKWNTVIHHKMPYDIKAEYIFNHYHESMVRKNKTDNIPSTLTPEQKKLFTEIFPDTYDKVMATEDNVLVFYSASWCDYCEATKARLLYAIEEAGVKNLKLYECDAHTNSINGIMFHGWPILKLYMKSDRTAPIDLDGFSDENMKKTLLKHLKE